jgi:hypothetical protein
VLAGIVNGIDGSHTAKSISVTGFELQDALGVPHNWFTLVVANSALPRGHLDKVSLSSPTTVEVDGWTYDPDHPDRPGSYAVSVDGTVGASAQTTVARPDVQRVYGLPQNVVGLAATAPIAAGTHTVCLIGVDQGSDQTSQVGCVSVDVPDVLGKVDLATTTGAAIRVAGWTFDRAHPDDAGRGQVVVDGTPSPQFTTTVARPDVQRVYSTGTNLLGYDINFTAAPGAHQVCVQGIDQDTSGTAPLRCVTLTVAG